MEEYRDTLLQGRTSRYLLVATGGVGMWKGMAARVSKLTRKYIPGSPGFAAHAFRHLVATDWLTRNPNDYLTVAELLNDKLSTVMAHYAHLKRDVSFLRYEQHVRDLLSEAR